MLAHPIRQVLFTSRPQGSGSRLGLWEVRGSNLQLVNDTWVSGHVVALAEHDGLWAATQNHMIRIPMEDLRSSRSFETSAPMRGIQAIVTQDLAAHHFNNA